MPLGLASIHDALNTLILQTFAPAPGTDVVFRFDQLGSLVSDADFTGPDGTYSPALAVERFSDLVNHVPEDAGDGVDVVLSEDKVDETYYYRLLVGSEPCPPDGLSDADRQAVTDTFNNVKAHALQLWTNHVLESSSGQLGQFHPATATPQDWYDTTKEQSWTHHAFDVGDGPAPTNDPPIPLWRLRIPPQALDGMLRPPGPPRVLPEATVRALREVVVQPATAPVDPAPVDPAPVDPAPVDPAPVAVAVARAAVREPVLPVLAVPGGLRATTQEVSTAPPPVEALDTRLTPLPLQERIAVRRFVADNGPTADVGTTSIHIAFDYCLVQADRPWWFDAFVTSTTWRVPATAAGEVTSGPHGMPLLPVALLAVRNLQISASWTGTDVQNAAQALQLGPFTVDPGVAADGTVSHPGIQVVGWLLQRLPSLPPQQESTTAPQPPTPSAAPTP